jgi:hypothetical protein
MMESWISVTLSGAKVMLVTRSSVLDFGHQPGLLMI